MAEEVSIWSSLTTATEIVSWLALRFGLIGRLWPSRFLLSPGWSHVHEVLYLNYHFRSFIQSDGILGTVALSQRTRFEPTWILFNLTSLGNDVLSATGCQVHELIPDPYLDSADSRCTQTGHTYNPRGADHGQGTQDVYPVGDLSGKHGNLRYIGAVLTVWDTSLPLYGPHSVIHRTLVLYRLVGLLLLATILWEWT